MKRLVRVTQLESFRKFITGDEDRENFVVTEQQVIDGITGVFTGNEQTRIGTAFHRIVEGNTEGVEKIGEGFRTFLYYGKEVQEYVPTGRKFNIDGHGVCLDVAQCKVALAYKNQYPDAFHEIREYMDMGDIVITGCADMIDGFEIRDIKTKFSAISDSQYTNSAQWRFYLEMFGAETFHFDLFKFEGYDKLKHGMDVRGLELKRYEPAITCHYYRGMVEDNRHLLLEFIKWAKCRDVYDLLPEYSDETVKNLH